MRRLLVAFAALAALTVLASPAQAVTANFTVRTSGTVSPAGANLTGTAICDDPSGFATLTLTTFAGSTGGVPLGTTDVQVVCDGTIHEWAATVPGVYSSGQVITVRGTLVEPVDGTSLTKTYKVTLS